tara:strand:- start:419 stop:913 length:495 start_codon:yes stop_codon:yes gene_type:complete
MKKYCKQKIPDNIKNKVWLKFCNYNGDIRFTQCYTCENFVMIPQSIRKYHDINYDILQIFVDEKICSVSGVGEFGHIISEKNGGKICEDNLIVQCKHCNCSNGSANIDIDLLSKNDIRMIDYNEDIDIEMGISNETCCQILKNGIFCKNNCMFNRNKCHIHLKN